MAMFQSEVPVVLGRDICKKVTAVLIDDGTCGEHRMILKGSIDGLVTK